MNEAIANAIFDILVSACAADRHLREAFVSWYRSGSPRPFRFGGGLLGGSGAFRRVQADYVFLPGRDATLPRLEVCARVNSRIRALYRMLNDMSPVQRLDWLEARQSKAEMR